MGSEEDKAKEEDFLSMQNRKNLLNFVIECFRYEEMEA
jgi:hypothetical protein